MSNDVTAALMSFVAAIARLALSSNNQIAYLHRIGTYPLLDELALEFDAGFRMLGPRDGAPSLSEQVLIELRRIDSLLDAMSGDIRLWQPEALDGAKWSEVRSAATEVLVLMGGSTV